MPTRTFLLNLRITLSHFSMVGLALSCFYLLALKIKQSPLAIWILNSSSRVGFGRCWAPRELDWAPPYEKRTYWTCIEVRSMQPLQTPGLSKW